MSPIVQKWCVATPTEQGPRRSPDPGRGRRGLFRGGDAGDVRRHELLRAAAPGAGECAWVLAGGAAHGVRGVCIVSIVRIQDFTGPGPQLAVPGGSNASPATGATSGLASSQASNAVRSPRLRRCAK